LAQATLSMGTQPRPLKRGTVHHFSTHDYCGQIAGWINIPLGTKVGLSPGDIVRWGTQLPRKKRHNPPTFRPMSIAAKRSPILSSAEHLFLNDMVLNKGSNSNETERTK